MAVAFVGKLASAGFYKIVSGSPYGSLSGSLSVSINDVVAVMFSTFEDNYPSATTRVQPTITDSQGLTWNRSVYLANAASPNTAVGIYYAVANATNTLTFTLAPGATQNEFSINFQAANYSGGDTVTPLIAAVTNTGQVAAGASSPAITAAGATGTTDSMSIGCASFQAGTGAMGLSAPAGWTEDGVQNAASASSGWWCGHRAEATSVTRTLTLTPSVAPSGGGSMAIIAITPSSGGGGGGSAVVEVSMGDSAMTGISTVSIAGTAGWKGELFDVPGGSDYLVGAKLGGFSGYTMPAASGGAITAQFPTPGGFSKANGSTVLVVAKSTTADSGGRYYQSGVLTGTVRGGYTGSGEYTGATHTAATLSFADVASAYNACSDGDILALPAGSANWAIPNKLTVNKRIYIKGAGSGSTTITRTGTTTAYDQWLIKVNVAGVSISDAKFVGNLGNGNTAEINQSWGLGFYGPGAVDFRVFSCIITGFSYAAITAEGSGARGVIYSNTIYDNFNPAVGNLGYGVQVGGGGDWQNPLQLGTANAIFVESNTMYGNRHNIASNNGSQYVFRYNTVSVTDAVKDWAQTDAHGYTGATHGSRSYEIYNNTYGVSGSLVWAAYGCIGIRGGDGVIWNNAISNGAGGNWDKFLILQAEGYPTDTTHDLYVWGNTGAVTTINNTVPSLIVLGVDYFLSAKPGYTPYAYPHPRRI